ncbi:hypothetical protein FACS189435_3910 [Bacteroidia bacterium]|nr:hypothetical protein FACS189435_3910 [Bacteroidia bacterium]
MTQKGGGVERFLTAFGMTLAFGKEGVAEGSGVSALSFQQNDFWADTETWFRLADEAAANFGASPVDPNNIINTAFAAYKKPAISREEAERTNTDHLGALTRQGQFHQFSFTANKGFETGGVLFSFNYRKEQGIIKNNDLDRLSGRFSFDFSPIKNVNMGVSTNFTYLKQQGAESSYGKSGSGGWAKWSTVLPWFKIHDDGNPDAAQPYWGAESGMNLLAGTLREFRINDMDSYRDISNAYAEWLLPVDGLKLRGDIAADVLITNSSRWASPLVSPRNPQVSEATERSATQANINYDVYANYNKTFGRHFVDFSAGGEAYQYSGYVRSASGMETQSAYPGLRAPKTMLSMSGAHAGESYLMGYFARGTYKLNDRYIVNASVRRDGLSAFSKENRWATFYALGAGWILSDEPFFSGAEWLNLLKPRFSYGTTGNTNVSNSMTMTQWGLNTGSNWDYPYSAGKTTLGPLGSAGLRWEINASTDVGFDFGLLNNRINGSFAYYNQSAKDLIMRTNLAPSAGLGSVYENVGNMKNYGIEFNVSSVNIRTEGFQWKTELNFSTNKNEVLNLNAGEKLQGYVMDNAVNDAYAFEQVAPKIRKEGYALNTYFMSVSAGVDPQTGIYMIEEIDQERWAKEGVTVKTGKLVPMTTNNAMNNRQVLEGKTPLPTFFGGFSNTFAYKGFDLNILFSFAGGHWIENFYFAKMHKPGVGDFGMVKDIDGNYWKKPGDIAKYPMLLTNEDYLYDDAGNPSTARYRYNTVNTDRWLEKGDFIRLRNLQLGYTLPASVSRSIGLGNVRVYAGGSNLLLFTGFQGLDPETNWEVCKKKLTTMPRRKHPIRKPCK